MGEAVTGAGIDWGSAVQALCEVGWSRVPGAVPTHAASALERAATGPWSTVPAVEGPGRVRQAGASCHSDVEDAPPVARALAAGIRAAVDAAAPAGVPPLPPFNHLEWSRPAGGRMHISAHRDPPTAGGVVAVVTLRGRARFRVWDLDGDLAEAEVRPDLAREWETGDGDLVLMRGGGWPDPGSRCPIHAAEMAEGGWRVTLTLRHNKGGFGADYFE